jgi:hypothetical protein
MILSMWLGVQRGLLSILLCWIRYDQAIYYRSVYNIAIMF